MTACQEPHRSIRHRGAMLGSISSCEHVGGGLASAPDTQHRVVTDRAAAVELSDTVELVIVRRPFGSRIARPSSHADRSDVQRAELIERERCPGA